MALCKQLIVTFLQQCYQPTLNVCGWYHKRPFCKNEGACPHMGHC